MHQPERFIPTQVGNTTASGLSYAVATVHPHARGEHQRGIGSDDQTAGSSPRTWGTRLDADAQVRVGRFIPTHVGNTDGVWGMGGG